MAAQFLEAQDGGYDVDSFAEPLDQDLICGICLCVAKEAVETPCAHLFCERCISSWLTKKSECPIDRKKMNTNEIFPTRFIRNKIANLKIECQKCGGKQTIKTIDAHEQKECPKRKVKCDICRKEYVFDEAVKHMADNISIHVLELYKHCESVKAENVSLKNNVAELQQQLKELLQWKDEEQKKPTEAPKEKESARSNLLTIGDMIDCLDTANKWLEASIVATKDDTVKVHFIGWDKRWDEWISPTSDRIARFGTRTQVEASAKKAVKKKKSGVKKDVKKVSVIEWAVGTEIDCLDTVRKWLAAVIIGYDPDKKQVKVHYDCWGSKWDEWINTDSDRLAPRGRYTNKQKDPD